MINTLRRSPALFSLFGVFLAGCPKLAAPPPSPPTTVTDSRPANSQPGGFLKSPPHSGGGSFGNTSTGKPVATTGSDDPLGVFGNPDGADESTQDHYLLQHPVTQPRLTISYNESWHFPNWVAWHLVASDIRTEDRGQFVPDQSLPDGFIQVTTRDYTNTHDDNGTKYDRGHNCPSKDRNPVIESGGAVDYVFFMNNITPQTHDMNAGPWERLETYSRELANEGKVLMIICGHGFKNMQPTRYLEKDNHQEKVKIAIPDFGWKIIVVTEPGEVISEQSRVIAVMMPNVTGIASEPWDNYIKTVADIETATGLKFFEGLSPTVAQALKQKRDEGVNSFTSAESGFRKSKRRTGGGSFGAGGRR